MIEVILLERIERLGHMGQVVKVRPGYARNFLLPNKKALRATKSNMELFEKQRAELEAKNATARTAAEARAAKMNDLKLVVIRQASEMGQLYGSVVARDVADAAKALGQEIDRLQVQIDAPIKALGLFPVKVRLHPEVFVKVTVNVARSLEEAVVQAEKGVALVKAAAAAAILEAEAAALGAVPVANDDTAATEAKSEKAPAKKKAKASKADAAEPASEEPAPKVKKAKAKKAAAE